MAAICAHPSCLISDTVVAGNHVAGGGCVTGTALMLNRPVPTSTYESAKWTSITIFVQHALLAGNTASQILMWIGLNSPLKHELIMITMS